MLQITSLKVIWLLCLCIICGCEIPAPIGTTESEVDRARSALVIGNGNYVNAAPLTNATNDAGDFATILRSLNYEVREHLNMDAAGMRSALQEFGLSLAEREFDAVVFFYSGHAIQIMGKNYLLPTDVRADNATNLISTAISIDEILEASAIIKVRIIILDACRDNPWQHSMGDLESPLRPGLAEISAEAGTFVAYSTAPNKIAYDGRNRNSFFTGALVQHAATPHLDISDLFTRVRRAVIESTDGAQVPWDHSSLTERFYLAQAPTTAEDFARGAPFGALAISTPFRGRIFLGTSTGIGNLDRAVNLALDRCRTFASSCGLKLIVYADECYAAAVDDATFAVGWAKADERQHAEEKAIKECIAAGGRACIPRESNCNWQ